MNSQPIKTGRIRRITDSDQTNAFPTWSPDGTRIAYHAFSTANVVNIYIAFPDGSPARALISDTGYNAFPDWSPNGTAIIYQNGQSGQSTIYTIPVTGGEATRFLRALIDDLELPS